MKTVIVLAMHGAPPSDFPKKELAEFFRLHNRIGGLKKDEALLRRYRELEAKMRCWPRNPQNDPYFEGAMNLANNLSKVTGLKVIVGFNEFCAPSLEEALEKAAKEGGEKVIVVTPMMTRGGEHSEIEIPQAVKAVQEKYPQTSFIYIWPFDTKEVAEFLSSQIKKHLEMKERKDS
jgi:sirohydrochlorin cobaltochelatase